LKLYAYAFWFATQFLCTGSRCGQKSQITADTTRAMDAVPSTRLCELWAESFSKRSAEKLAARGLQVLPLDVPDLPCNPRTFRATIQIF
jgi:hypothetical protein